MMAQRFAQRNEPLPMLVSSTAKRAISTARAFAKALGDAPITERPEVYHAPLQTLMHIVESLPDAAQQVMVFGHNPGLSELVEHLAGQGLGSIDPCTTVRIDLHVDSWKAAAADTGTAVWWDAPSED